MLSMSPNLISMANALDKPNNTFSQRNLNCHSTGSLVQ